MTILYVNTGSSTNAGDGDSLRTAFTKINANFGEVSTQLSNIEVGTTSTLVAGTYTFALSTSGAVTLNGDPFVSGGDGEIRTDQDLFTTSTVQFNEVILKNSTYDHYLTFSDIGADPPFNVFTMRYRHEDDKFLATVLGTGTDFLLRNGDGTSSVQLNGRDDAGTDQEWDARPHRRGTAFHCRSLSSGQDP